MLPIRKLKQVLYSGLCLPFQLSAFHGIHNHVDCHFWASHSFLIFVLPFVWGAPSFVLYLVDSCSSFNTPFLQKHFMSPSLYPQSSQDIFNVCTKNFVKIKIIVLATVHCYHLFFIFIPLNESFWGWRPCLIHLYLWCLFGISVCS